MRNGTLSSALEAFTLDVSAALETSRAQGAEVPFEVVEKAGGPTPLYCYRARTGEFIGERLGLLTALPTYAAAARALEAVETTGAYLRQRGVREVPSDPRERAEIALEQFIAAVFDDRNQFEFDRDHFAAALSALERALYHGRCVTTAVAPLLGVTLDSSTTKVELGDGLALVRGETFEEAPYDAVWGEGEASVLVVFTLVRDRRAPDPIALIRSQLRRVVTALRLFEPGGYALGATAWMKVDTGSWRPFALPFCGNPGAKAALPAEHEDELRGFFNLIAARAAASGRLSWALARFEMAAERATPFEALTDYLLAARVLLEPEGPGAGRVAERLAAICAAPAHRARVSGRIAEAQRLERLVASGTAPSDKESEGLVAELCEHVRALLRDMLCGHLEGDVSALADQLLVQAGSAAVVPPVPTPASQAPSDQPTDELAADQVGLGVDRQ
ncbi:MAG TPA: hypothetical protein VGL78_02280 [Solirubrobacteraceae bacterium]|jgi:hypothetical protein